MKKALTRALTLLPVLIVLAGCAASRGGPAIVSGSSPVAQAQAIERMADFLSGLGFTVDNRGATVVTARAAAGVIDPVWVDCPKITYSDPFADGRRRVTFTDLRLLGGEVQATATTTTAGTDIRALASFMGGYRNRYINLARQAPCTSTGVLERLVVEAAGGITGTPE